MRDPEGKAVLTQLGQVFFVPFGCKRYGVSVQNEMSYEQLIEEAGIPIVFGRLRLEHDGAGAPLLVDGEGTEQVRSGSC